MLALFQAALEEQFNLGSKTVKADGNGVIKVEGFENWFKLDWPEKQSKNLPPLLTKNKEIINGAWKEKVSLPSGGEVIIENEKGRRLVMSRVGVNDKGEIEPRHSYPASYADLAMQLTILAEKGDPKNPKDHLIIQDILAVASGKEPTHYTSPEHKQLFCEIAVLVFGVEASPGRDSKFTQFLSMLLAFDMIANQATYGNSSRPYRIANVFDTAKVDEKGTILGYKETVRPPDKENYLNQSLSYRLVSEADHFKVIKQHGSDSIGGKGSATSAAYHQKSTGIYAKKNDVLDTGRSALKKSGIKNLSVWEFANQAIANHRVMIKMIKTYAYWLSHNFKPEKPINNCEVFIGEVKDAIKNKLATYSNDANVNKLNSGNSTFDDFSTQKHVNYGTSKVEMKVVYSTSEKDYQAKYDKYIDENLTQIVGEHEQQQETIEKVINSDKTISSVEELKAKENEILNNKNDNKDVDNSTVNLIQIEKLVKQWPEKNQNLPYEIPENLINYFNYFSNELKMKKGLLELFDLYLHLYFKAPSLTKDNNTIGECEIKGWELKNVKGDGNCFYEAVALQLQKLGKNEVFILIKNKSLIKGNNLPLRNYLRSIAEGTNFKDKRWASYPEICKLCQELKIVIAIVDTRSPKNYLYHYTDENGNHQFTNKKSELPEGKDIIKLAYTGNHYLSVGVEAHGFENANVAMDDEMKQAIENSMITFQAELVKANPEILNNNPPQNIEEAKISPLKTEEKQNTFDYPSSLESSLEEDNLSQDKEEAELSQLKTEKKQNTFNYPTSLENSPKEDHSSQDREDERLNQLEEQLEKAIELRGHAENQGRDLKPYEEEIKYLKAEISQLKTGKKTNKRKHESNRSDNEDKELIKNDNEQNKDPENPSKKKKPPSSTSKLLLSLGNNNDKEMTEDQEEEERDKEILNLSSSPYSPLFPSSEEKDDDPNRKKEPEPDNTSQHSSPLFNSSSSSKDS